MQYTTMDIRYRENYFVDDGGNKLDDGNMALRKMNHDRRVIMWFMKKISDFERVARD